MGARKGTGGTGVRDGRTAATRVGHWYAEGPEGRRFVAGDPAARRHRRPDQAESWGYSWPAHRQVEAENPVAGRLT